MRILHGTSLPHIWSLLGRSKAKRLGHFAAFGHLEAGIAEGFGLEEEMIVPFRWQSVELGDLDL